MFFRHKATIVPAFDERLGSLRSAGFTSQSSPHGTMVTRNGFGAILQDGGDGKVGISKAGIVVGSEVATLYSVGYQMLLRTPSGKEFPARAEQLKALHSFEEDLTEALGQVSLYNIGLGTTSDAHMYDRVADRDHQTHRRPWQK
jgi:hypothetical protein